MSTFTGFETCFNPSFDANKRVHVNLLTIEMLINIHVMADPRGHRSWSSPAGEAAINWLTVKGLIVMRPGDEIPQTTQRGRAWLSMMQETPLPQQIGGYADPRTGMPISET